MARHRDHRLALPVLYLRQEGSGHRQGGEIGRHSGCHPAVHAQLDRQVHGAELAGGAVAGHLSSLAAQRADGVLHEPAEQTEEVKAQLAAITPSSLDPEVLTLIDPASGSGHILVEAYELFKAIYLERGYRQRDVPQLILEKNLYGLDIDGRAAQLTGFALMMKGRADDRRLFERGVKLNVMTLQDSTGFEVDEFIRQLESSEKVELVPSGDLFPDTLPQPELSVAPKNHPLATAVRSLITLFEHATTFGSIIYSN